MWPYCGHFDLNFTYNVGSWGILRWGLLSSTKQLHNTKIVISVHKTRVTEMAKCRFSYFLNDHHIVEPPKCVNP